MKGGPLYKKIIYSSLFLAIAPAAAVMLFIKPVGLRYTLEINRSKNTFLQIHYADLNSDSISEVVGAVKGTSYDFLTFKTNDLRIYDQWNLDDSLDNNISGIIIGNYDGDSYGEVYVFSYKSDSLFLNVNEILDTAGIKRNHIFISKIEKKGGKVESYLYPAGFFDKNDDGFKEFYFVLTSCFDACAGRIYSYDFVSGQIDQGPETNIAPLYPKMVDADNDSRPEIFGTLRTAGSPGPDVPFSGGSTWFMVLNDELEFKFTPIEFAGFGNILETHSFNGCYAVLHWAGGTDPDIISSRLMLYTTDGKLIKYKLLSELGFTRQASMLAFNNAKSDRLILVGDKLAEINGDIDVIRTFQVPFKSEFFVKQADVNNDGEEEMLLYSESEGLLLLVSQDLRIMAESKMIAQPACHWKISYLRAADGVYRTVVHSDESAFYLTLGPNKYFYLSYLRYPGIYIAFILFIALIRRINTLQVVQKEDIKQRLLTLQLQGIKAQLDPHFTFNTLNSVASMIYLKDSQNAYDYMNKFTQLLRIMLNDAEKIYRSLGEEIQFVCTYFELEKLRFGDRLNYRIEVGEGITQREKVPRLVIHTFAENAIKHGITPKADGGTILITILRKGNYLKILVEDDGIGREQARLQQQNAGGKGLKLTKEFFDILNKMNSRPVSYHIYDIFNGFGEPAGTRVEIRIPF